MKEEKNPSCSGWILSAAGSWVLAGLFGGIAALQRFPGRGWFFPALAAGIWVTLALYSAGWKLQREAPEDELHPILYFVATAFALTAGTVVFVAAIHAAFTH